jgi:hypothetical protein
MKGVGIADWHREPDASGQLEVRPASRRPKDLARPPAQTVSTDSVAVLLADRALSPIPVS